MNVDATFLNGNRFRIGGLTNRQSTIDSKEVAQLLELLAAGMTHQEILADYPYLEEADIQTSLLYAAHIANARSIVTLPLVS